MGNNLMCTVCVSHILTTHPGIYTAACRSGDAHIKVCAPSPKGWRVGHVIRCPVCRRKCMLVYGKVIHGDVFIRFFDDTKRLRAAYRTSMKFVLHQDKGRSTVSAVPFWHQSDPQPAAQRQWSRKSMPNGTWSVLPFCLNTLLTTVHRRELITKDLLLVLLECPCHLHTKDLNSV